jgi:hypothetical protein
MTMITTMTMKQMPAIAPIIIAADCEKNVESVETDSSLYANVAEKIII